MDGIYDILLETIPSDNARQLFGTLFERYINMLFEDFLAVPPPLARRFAKDPKYVGEKKNDQAGDGIILMSEMVVLMEYKGGILTRTRSTPPTFAPRSGELTNCLPERERIPRELGNSSTTSNESLRKNSCGLAQRFSIFRPRQRLFRR